jgi:hypothetical protein
MSALSMSLVGAATGGAGGVGTFSAIIVAVFTCGFHGAYFRPEEIYLDWNTQGFLKVQ